jgi:hypothetical protein
MDALPLEIRQLVEELHILLGLSSGHQTGDPVPTHLAYSDVLPALRTASDVVRRGEVATPASRDEIARAVSRLGELGSGIARLAAGGAMDPTIVDAYDALILRHRHVLESWRAVAESAPPINHADDRL